MIRKRERRLLALTAAASLFGGAAWAALWADNVPTSVVADGGFEDAEPVLRLDDVAAYPLIAGGWGVRSGRAGLVATTVTERGRVLEIESRDRGAVQAIQDVPLGSRGFVLEAAVQRWRGRQQIRLLAEWDRRDGDRDQAVTLVLTPAGLEVVTSAGRWQLPVRLPAGEWMRLRVVGDPRDEQLRVSVDDELVGVLPGLPESRPSTLLLGSARGQGISRVRYDEVALMRLAEVELAALRLELQREAPPDLERSLQRLDAAAAALGDGASFLALPELRALARDLERTGADANSPSLRAALALTELLQVS